ncbi:MAG: hypothetical protein FWF41_07810 [Betaproteobacteria bacterium]|nr:hypothetical protein [Betaproteobacteria bacterium]
MSVDGVADMLAKVSYQFKRFAVFFRFKLAIFVVTEGRLGAGIGMSHFSLHDLEKSLGGGAPTPVPTLDPKALLLRIGLLARPALRQKWQMKDN